MTLWPAFGSAEDSASSSQAYGCKINAGTSFVWEAGVWLWRSRMGGLQSALHQGTTSLL